MWILRNLQPMKIKLLSVYLFLYYCNKVAASIPEDNGVRSQVTFMDPGTIVDYKPKSRHRGFFENDMRIYCYRGSLKDLTRFFENVELNLEIEGDEYTQYEGVTPMEVRQHFEERRSLFNFNLFSQKRARLQLSPFKQQCIGIDTTLPYRVRLLQIRVDNFRVLELALGISIFVFAGKLSDNSLFFYFTGIAFGICSSFMLLIWLSSKLMPRRPMVYGMLIGGWALGVYIIQRLWENLHLIFQMYRVYVLWYIFLTGLLSFFFCYRVGPPKNRRSKNIIKWILQIMALALIYISSQYEEASAAIGVLTIVVNYFPYYIFHKLLKIYRRFFPPKRRLLTNDEFYEQGVIETSKALNELRAFASSPDCNQWKIISKLRDPLRFAAFVEGDSHLRDEEMSNFESFSQGHQLDETDLSEQEDEKTLKQCQSRNLAYYNCKNLPREICKRRRNIVYEEMSEEESDSGDNMGNEEIVNANKAKDFTSNINNKNQSNSMRSSVRQFYSDEFGKTRFAETYNTHSRKKHLTQDCQQQAQFIPGIFPKRPYSDPNESGGSESDD
ncbi:nuclear envelope integral membrane protein 1a [Rhagoletis pomonella]|uniref:nuclear envelope integral membrane protein 1a n=1 Tax=Rhagoletis pomonella TaxID=28610 RepID=UPI00177BB069|nr:nuclear envelope integral membrane protein 1a [Rhagoletis pomonella]